MLPVYGATIKVIAGFYIGCTGFITEPYNSYMDQFVVNLRCEYKVEQTKIIDMLKVTLQLKDFEITSEPRK